MKKLIMLMGAFALLTGCQEEYKQADINDQTDVKAEAILTTQQEQTDSQNENKLVLEEAYFNEVMSVNGKQLIQNPDNLLILVNKAYLVSEDYAPQDLVRPNVAFSFGDQDIEKSYMRKEAALALEEMFNDAANQGISLFAVSGYRSYPTQMNNYHYQISALGEEQAVKVSAAPGTSEHQTGLAMDISSSSVNYELTEKFGETAEGTWLRENAHKHGFILRYPKGSEDITGYSYEPWHYRYVGKEAARDIFENRLTLEEFFKIVEKI
jgi:D-alanyl-D-alanine carboxypeptidase